jgi:hypothetical protein
MKHKLIAAVEPGTRASRPNHGLLREVRNALAAPATVAVSLDALLGLTRCKKRSLWHLSATSRGLGAGGRSPYIAHVEAGARGSAPAVFLPLGGFSAG